MSISRRRSALFGPGRFGRMRTSPWRWWSSFRPRKRAIRSPRTSRRWAMVVLISGKAVRISPAPLPGCVLSAEDGYRLVPEPAPDICYDYADTPAVALRECVIRLTTDPVAGPPPPPLRPPRGRTPCRRGLLPPPPSPRSQRDGAKVAAQATFRPRGCRSSAAPMEEGVDSFDAIQRVLLVTLHIPSRCIGRDTETPTVMGMARKGTTLSISTSPNGRRSLPRASKQSDHRISPPAGEWHRRWPARIPSL